MTQSLEIRKVESKQDFRAFFKFPWKVYKNDPNWVPPLLSMRRELLDKDHNPSWEYLEGDYFVAWRGDEPVGTITAVINHRHNEFHNENIAWFGFFETIDDPQVAHALLNTAYEWAKAKGCTAIRGPQSFTTHEECGLLVDGFEPPVILMPYNPPYYQALVEGAGFEKVMDVHSFYYDHTPEEHEQFGNAKRIEKISARIMRQNNARVRTFNNKRRKQDFQLFKELYNTAWVANWGFTPMTDRELDGLIKSLGMFLDPRTAWFVEVNEEPVGFMLAVQDLNAILKRANARPGTPEFISLVKALWHWKIRPKVDRMRVPLMGVKPEYRNKGLDVLMYAELRNVLSDPKLPYRALDCGWILETNQDMAGTLLSVGMRIYKTHRFYEKAT
ncbi:MAG: GNAT family N-acetyltransferase [Anaerolineae bacterium]|nr:GNAT family N-acetyltransferase [Anaerolineae bacterium]